MLELLTGLVLKGNGIRFGNTGPGTAELDRLRESGFTFFENSACLL